MFRTSTKSKSEVFEFIARKGGDEAVVYFSGGNDEGGVNNISIRKDGKEVCELQELYETSSWDGTKWVTSTPTDPDKPYIDSLVAPVYGKYHSFAGDFYVDGVLTWNCKDKTCKMDGSETTPSSEGFEEEF